MEQGCILYRAMRGLLPPPPLFEFWVRSRPNKLFFRDIGPGMWKLGCGPSCPIMNCLNSDPWVLEAIVFMKTWTLNRIEPQTPSPFYAVLAVSRTMDASRHSHHHPPQHRHRRSTLQPRVHLQTQQTCTCCSALLSSVFCYSFLFTEGNQKNEVCFPPFLSSLYF